MSDDVFIWVAAISALASVVAVWSRFRQQQSLRRLLRSLNDEQREELKRILEQKEDPSK